MPEGVYLQAPLTGDTRPLEGIWYQADQLRFQLIAGDGAFVLAYRLDADHHGRAAAGNTREIRYAGDLAALRLAPRLADRTLVARLNQPLLLAPGNRLFLIVSSPLWVAFMIDSLCLADLPAARLSDTWFGPNFTAGELCYACRTRARLSHDEAAQDPWRALTRVEVINEAEDPLLLERLNIPVPNLSLFRSATDWWTSSISITRTHAADAGEIKLREYREHRQTELKLMAGPRSSIKSGVILKTMDLLFG